MNLNEEKNYSDSTATEPATKTESKKMAAWEKNLIAGGICFCIGMAGPIAVGMNMRSNTNKAHQRTISELKEENRSLKKQLEEQKGNNAPAPVTKSSAQATAPATKKADAAPTSDAPVPKEPAGTYENNEYYDIVETSTFMNSINDTVLIHKVLAKKDVSVSATLLAYGEDGSVLGKSSDDIVLTAGQYNYFKYYFESDISNASMQPTFKLEKDSLSTGVRNPNAVEMVQYNQSGNNLYVTFKQNVDELNYFAKFKILYYKGDSIVNADDGYFSSHAQNLNGNGSTDVAELWAYNIDYDRIEYMYEP